MEQKLEIKKIINDSDEDEDGDDEEGKKSSIHSSDITDFGEPQPDKNSLKNVSSGELSDIE